MAEIKFSLPGLETVTLSGQTIDKLIRAGDGEAALLYLYILKTRGQSTSDEAAAAMGKSPGGIATAMALLSRLGLIKLDDANTYENADAISGLQGAPPDEPRGYTFEEISRELTPGSSFKLLAVEAENSLGKKLSPDELMRLYGIYDGLRLPPEVILHLITHCIAESRQSGGGRAPSLRYIEKAAYTWEREGIFSLEKAEEYLKMLDARKSARGEIKRAMQIKDREFSASEKRYVDSWIAKGFDRGAVEIAYDRTVLKTGKLAWSYMNSIMNSWHSKNLHTPEEIIKKDRVPDGRVNGKNADAPDKKFGAPNHEEIERMERLLKKIKEE